MGHPNEGWQNRFEVRETPGRGKGLFIKGPFKKDDILFRFTGTIVPKEKAFCHDVQVGPQQFMQLDEPWRYINHSCDPACGMASDVDVIALRDGADEELNFDYGMTDWTDWGNDAPIICHCRTEFCRKVYMGYIGLTRVDKERYAGRIAPWLVRREERYDTKFFLGMRMVEIAQFATKGQKFLQSPEELDTFLKGVMYNLDRIVEHDIW